MKARSSSISWFKTTIQVKLAATWVSQLFKDQNKNLTLSQAKLCFLIPSRASASRKLIITDEHQGSLEHHQNKPQTNREKSSRRFPLCDLHFKWRQNFSFCVEISCSRWDFSCWRVKTMLEQGPRRKLFRSSPKCSTHRICGILAHYSSRKEGWSRTRPCPLLIEDKGDEFSTWLTKMFWRFQLEKSTWEVSVIRHHRASWGAAPALLINWIPTWNASL